MFDAVWVDGDVLVYRCGFAVEHTTYELRKKAKEGLSFVDKFSHKAALNTYLKEHKIDEKTHIWSSNHYVEPLSNALQAVNTTLNSIYDALQCDMGAIFLSGEENFRLQVDPEYKANRKDKPKPKHYQQIREYLMGKWNAREVDRCEADDMLGIHQIETRRKGGTSVIATIDKDLDMIPGWHYNWVKQDLYDVSDKEASYNFFLQLLTGDVTDNVVGLKGIGPVKAKKLLAPCETVEQMYQVCQSLYYKVGRKEDFDKNQDLLWILRDFNLWEHHAWRSSLIN